ncbi:VPLPA-CTERM protein sorting domain-containing protein [Roseovarius pacificus]|uniref:VPLPA-CTERM protein sorting domain-containing protein n=1 Tax=Roseovarius pacificus TaxID=337701 RepID=A0A1M6WXL6_9RHOB|nr:VPLPA-CTERM sorting domain-containing protein [Roseovarius pacificus]GGO52827.1 hypothetical protein GCM10011315_09300 [Roseovarius pacificus]SHK98295.1 VPLPA-CTERM protein sorting domain-containing protein [Roseovarius pacificus]
MKSTIISSLVAVLASTSFAVSATYDLFFYEGPTVGNTASNNSQSGRNINDVSLAGTGRLDIADSAVAPNASIALNDSTRIELSISYTDIYDETLNWTLPGDTLSTNNGNDAFVLLDPSGAFKRFDLEGTTTAVPGISIADEDTPAPAPFGPNGHPVASLQDGNNFNLGYVTEAFSAPNSIRDWLAGDFIDRDTWEALGSQGDFMAFAGTYRFDNSQRDRVSSGVILASLRDGGTDPDPDDTPNVIPLPASGFFLLAGLGALGALRRRSSTS